MALAFVMNRRSQLPAEDSPAFGAIAERFRRAGELERAVSLCQEGLLKFPEHLSARVTLGWALLDLGQYKEARTELERVIKRAPDNLAAIRGLAELHDRMENADASDLHGADWAPVEEAAGRRRRMRRLPTSTRSWRQRSSSRRPHAIGVVGARRRGRAARTIPRSATSPSKRPHSYPRPSSSSHPIW